MAKKNNVRRKAIEKQIQTEQQATVEQLAARYHVTPETIRTDLRFLEEKGSILRIHGGAVIRPLKTDPPITVRYQEDNHEKRAISKKILPFIHDGAMIYIDGGSTVLPLMHFLETKRDLTIVTDSYELVRAGFSSRHTIYALGGKLYKKGHMLVGDYALQMVQTMRFDTCILGMDGCKGANGPANGTPVEVILDQIVMHRSKQKILAAAAGKFEQEAAWQYADFSDFDVLITTSLPATVKAQLPIDQIIETEKEK